MAASNHWGDRVMALPATVPFGGVWTDYVETIYKIYVDQIANAALTFQTLPIRCKYVPATNGKHFGFWHVISEGESEEDRLPDFRRCERITWIAYLTSNADTDADITWWENKRGSDTHVVIWHEAENFVVILAKRKDYYLLKTAYCPKSHRAKTFVKERDNYWKQKG